MNRSAKVEILETEIAAVKAQNDRLNEENTFLRDKLNRLTANTRSTAATNVEAKIKAFQLEDERDQMFYNLEALKKKYNKLHEAYSEKVKRCKILENTFQRQKTLTGLVMKSAIRQRSEEQAAAQAAQAAETLDPKLTKLQNELDEAYDIIDALEFELETVDLLEVENQRLREELSALKSNYQEIKKEKNFKTGITNEEASSVNGTSGTMIAGCKHQSTDSDCHECTKEWDIDGHTLERAVLTNSVIENIEVESNMLRRQLLKCRLENANKSKGNP